MRCTGATQHDIDTAAGIIRRGGLVAFPTETVYGLGANALDPRAVAGIFEMKERPSFDPLIVHIADLRQMDGLVSAADERVEVLARAFWPGPLTMVLEKSGIVPGIVTSDLPTVGIRMPDNHIARALIEASGCPIAAPSANKFGRISPTTAAHVKKQLPGVDCILDGGKTTVGIESTIITLTDRGFVVLRSGIITREDLEKYIPSDPQSIADVQAPGMLKSHYSPRKKLLILNDTLSEKEKSTAGLISFTGEAERGFGKVIRVSQRNDLKDYAVNMFEAMHAFEDDDEVMMIAAEPVAEAGIGRAIMDRLKKAEYDWRQE
ncbi:MAG: threonylcarbamoyl-AMP synthase [Spirochaetales bacterium]|nr:threonylcarbamoyl-AMP synthase [Spirochaetales bacterium]